MYKNLVLLFQMTLLPLIVCLRGAALQVSVLPRVRAAVNEYARIFAAQPPHGTHSGYAGCIFMCLDEVC